MAHFLHMTRNCNYREGYEVESEPDTDDTDSYMVYSDSESNMERQCSLEQCTIVTIWRWRVCRWVEKMMWQG